MKLTPLHWAAKRGLVKILKLLLSKKVFLDQRDIYGKTALFYALKYNRFKVVKLLIANFAKPWFDNSIQSTKNQIFKRLLAFAGL